MALDKRKSARVRRGILLCSVLSIMFVSVLLHLNKTSAENILTREQGPRFLVIFPGFGGSPSNKANILRSIQFYSASLWKCVVFQYAGESVLFNHCQTVRVENASWTVFLHLIRPEYVVRNRFTHVVVHIEDVHVPDFYGPLQLIEFMKTYDLDVVSPSIYPTIYPVMNRTGGIGQLVSFIEVQITAFKSLAWLCFWDLIDLEDNVSGWGIDLCLFQLCKLRMGIMHKFSAQHMSFHTGSSMSSIVAQQQMEAWFLKRVDNSSLWQEQCTFPSDYPVFKAVDLVP